MTAAMRSADGVYAMNPPAYNAADMFAVARDIGRRYVVRWTSTWVTPAGNFA